MNYEDEIWVDVPQVSGSQQQYSAVLVDLEDVASNLDDAKFDAENDEEGTSKAHAWALAVCETLGKKGLLTVVGGGIHGSWSKVIEPEPAP